MVEVKILKGNNDLEFKDPISIESLPDTPINMRKVNLESEKIRGFISGEYSAKIQGNNTSQNDYSTFTIDHNMIKEGNFYGSQLGSEEKMSTSNNNNQFEMLFTELKTDMRERESRTRSEITEREHRFEKQLEKLSQEAKEREERYMKEASEREERILKALDQVEQRVNVNLSDIKESSTRSEERIDAISKHVQSIVTTNFWGRIATIIAILGISVASVISIYLATNNNNDTPPPPLAEDDFHVT